MSYYFGGKPHLDSDDARDKDEDLYTDDSSFTLRVNSELKQRFIDLCRKEHYTASAALKRYMHRCVEKGAVTHDFRSLRDSGERL